MFMGSDDHDFEVGIAVFVECGNDDLVSEAMRDSVG